MQHKIGNNRLCIICLIILFMIQIVFLEQYNGTIFADELGYWGTAAFINNKNWSYVLSQISYYSYIWIDFRYSNGVRTIIRCVI